MSESDFECEPELSPETPVTDSSAHQNGNVHPKNFSVGEFIVVKIKYDEGTKKESLKKFIGQVTSMSAKHQIYVLHNM